MPMTVCGIEAETLVGRYVEYIGLTEMERQKQNRQQKKNDRLLARMAPELELAKKEWQSSPWFPGKCVYSGGGYYMGWPKAERRTDTRRVRENDLGIRGLRTIRTEDGFKFRKGRNLIGNRNGSEKSLDLRPRDQKPTPRSAFRKEVMQELHDELTLTKEEIVEIERKRAIEEKWERESYGSCLQIIAQPETEPTLSLEPELMLTPEARRLLRQASDNPRAMGFYPHQY